jgi:hypothetical protein
MFGLYKAGNYLTETKSAVFYVVCMYDGSGLNASLRLLDAKCVLVDKVLSETKCREPLMSALTTRRLMTEQNFLQNKRKHKSRTVRGCPWRENMEARLLHLSFWLRNFKLFWGLSTLSVKNTFEVTLHLEDWRKKGGPSVRWPCDNDATSEIFWTQHVACLWFWLNFFLIRIVGGWIQIGSTWHVGH